MTQDNYSTLISGNETFGLSAELAQIMPRVTCMSRSSGIDLCDKDGRNSFAHLAAIHDVVIINAALWQFQQTVLLDTVYKACVEADTTPHIIAIGSTTDRVKKGGAWLYNAEKKALRDYCNTLSINGVWGNDAPKVSYISFGTLSNNQNKHPDRKTLDIKEAAYYVKWLAEQPKYVNINEISIDPMQGTSWNE